jgi:SulP family sulfate permease
MVLPLTLFVALAIYNLVVAVFAIPPEVLRETGWVVPMRADAGLWPPIVPADLAVVDWNAILASALMLPGIVIVTAMALLMNATGIELDTDRDVDLDKELRSVGLQNLAAGAGGGVPGYPAVSLSLLAERLGAANRLVGLIVAAVAGCVLFLGELVLDLVPTPLLGSLLVWIGAALTYECLVLAARRLALWEYLIVLLIFVVIVGVSFTSGIMVGLVAAIVLFVVEYARVDSVRHVLTGETYQSTFEMSEERRDGLRQFGHAILIVRLQGFIFFGTSDRLRKKIQDRLSDLVRFVIVDFRHVTGVDSSAVVSFVRLSKLASRLGFTMVVTGMNEPVARALTRGNLNAGASVRIEPDIDRGLVWCENRLLARLAPELDAERPRDLAELTFSLVKDARLAVDLSGYFEPVALDEGELLVEGGSPSDEMYLVGSGRGAVTVMGAGNAAVRIATVGPGAIVGEVAFFLDQPRNASVVVESPMTAWRFSRKSLARLQKEMPDLAFRFHEGIAAMMAARLTSTNRLVVFLAD